jgi:predicted acyl esterase
VARGDRLRLSIALAAWPQIAVNAGDGTLARSNASPAHRVITVELTLEDSSFSILPMVRAN